MINKHKGGSIISDLQNIQSELAYTTDDTYLFNYKNKEKELEKLLYKLSRYEKKCKKRKKEIKEEQKKIEKVKENKKKKSEKKLKENKSEKKVKENKSEKKVKENKSEKKVKENKSEKKVKEKKSGKKVKKKKSEKKVKEQMEKIKNENKKIEVGDILKDKGIVKLMGGGEIMEKIPNMVFIPIIGPLLLENNRIKLENNENLIEDLLIFIINNAINILELGCIIYLIMNSDNLNKEDLFVIGVVLLIRILSTIFIYKKNNEKTLNKKYNENINRYIVLIILGLPLFLILFNVEKYELDENIILTFIITILTLPYIRLIYNKIRKNEYNENTGLWLNISEKIICGIVIYIIIKNKFNLEDIFNFIKENSKIEVEDKNEIKVEDKNEIEVEEKIDKELEENSDKENIIVNNFNNLFKKKYI